MEIDEIARALETCDTVLKHNGHKPVQESKAGNRARWCAQEAVKKLDTGEFTIGKANRWLGFCQGVIYALGYASIDELKLMNRARSTDVK